MGVSPPLFVNGRFIDESTAIVDEKRILSRNAAGISGIRRITVGAAAGSARVASGGPLRERAAQWNAMGVPAVSSSRSIFSIASSKSTIRTWVRSSRMANMPASVESDSSSAPV